MLGKFEFRAIDPRRSSFAFAQKAHPATRAWVEFLIDEVMAYLSVFVTANADNIADLKRRMDVFDSRLARIEQLLESPRRSMYLTRARKIRILEQALKEVPEE